MTADTIFTKPENTRDLLQLRRERLRSKRRSRAANLFAADKPAAEEQLIPFPSDSPLIAS